MSTTFWAKSAGIPGKLTFMEGKGELPKLQVNGPNSTAEIYLDGAQVTHFERKGETPLLFLSQLSRFESGKPIRGGVPIIFPWFGPREGEPVHGFARTKTWELREISQLPMGGMTLKFGLPDSAEASLMPRFKCEYIVTVSKKLTLELVVENASPDQDLTFENCLHTYFAVGDINSVSISGLKGAKYLDKVDNFARKTENAEHIKIAGEVDRIYLDTPDRVEIHDSKLGRRIVIEKSGSLSTVVWNPWTAKAQQMPDFGNEEYLQMVCVESGNVSDNRLTLPAGKTHSMKIEIGSLPL